MSLLMLIVVLVLIGVGLYVVSLVPMDPTIRKIIVAVVVVAVVLWLLDVFFGISGTTLGHVPRVR